MAGPNWMVVFSQLAGQSPTLLVYLVGIVLCAVWWRRAPRAAMLAMVGCGLLLFTSVAISFVQVYYINNRGSMPVSSLSAIMTTVALVGSVLRGAGFVLLLCAVFAGRPRVFQESGFEVQQQQYPPPVRY
jgi:uncharacterized membrane protein